MKRSRFSEEEIIGIAPKPRQFASAIVLAIDHPGPPSQRFTRKILNVGSGASGDFEQHIHTWGAIREVRTWHGNPVTRKMTSGVDPICAHHHERRHWNKTRLNAKYSLWY